MGAPVGSEELAGMPAALRLRRQAVGTEVVVSYGGAVLAVYDRADRGMRNLAIVALRRAGVAGVEVAALFGVRPERVSRLYRGAKEGGAASLVPPMGRPSKLGAIGLKQAYALADSGQTGTEIAAALGVSEATISRQLRRRPGPAPEALDFDGTADDGSEGEVEVEVDGGGEEEEEEDGGEDGGEGSSIPRIGAGEVGCAYAGAMLLHGFLDRVGAGAVLAALPSGPARRYDAASLVLSATFAFSLGASSAEGTKHLLGADAGALVGLGSFPHLRTLRPRLGALADLIDPLGVQVALAKAMLDADASPPEVFFVDDHFVAYTGARPVGKGWNTRRRHAEPGRDDTVIVDGSWRAICFASGPPSGLSKTMWGPLEQLRAVCGQRPVTIGFDRGGAYPATFAELARRGFDWVTYRRAPLAVPTVAPKRSWVSIAGSRHYLSVADETVTLEGVGPVRQISVYELGRVVLQILTSDRTTPAARMAHTLRCRWCIENTFKYLEDHQGIHWLCDYRMDVAPDTALVANPARTQARNNLKAAEATVAEMERRIGNTATKHTTSTKTTNEALADLQSKLKAAQADRDDAQAALKPVPAKLPATDLDPAATRAWPRTNRRAMQMVCRLLAYNAELDLARALNCYLVDPNEYRAITRHLLRQPGTIRYSPTAVAVAIREPDAPRIAHALGLLVDQLNANPPLLAGDNRPITYRIDPKP
ncbi:MAG: hypothetical protein M3256_23675 [Actinomycetota bacterium]|nr:hypothetical protein [Actinomycetota bacterium]